MLSFAEIPGDKGGVSMNIYGIILTGYSEKYLYQLTRMETGPRAAYFHFIHAFGNGRRSYASEPIAKRTVRSVIDTA
jgi:hypothetical protein